MAEENGFVPFEDKAELTPGDKVNFDNRKKNRTTAINELISIGINAILAEEAEKQKAAEAADATPAAEPVNPVEAITDVLCRAGIIKPGEDISDSDLAFLKAIFMAVEAHFQN